MVSEQLRKAIVESKETHYRIWKESGVNSRVIDRFMAGEQDIRGSTIDRLCVHLGLELCRKKGRATTPKQAKKKPETRRRQVAKKTTAKRKKSAD